MSFTLYCLIYIAVGFAAAVALLASFGYSDHKEDEPRLIAAIVIFMWPLAVWGAALAAFILSLKFILGGGAVRVARMFQNRRKGS